MNTNYIPFFNSYKDIIKEMSDKDAGIFIKILCQIYDSFETKSELNWNDFEIFLNKKISKKLKLVFTIIKPIIQKNFTIRQRSIKNTNKNFHDVHTTSIQCLHNVDTTLTHCCSIEERRKNKEKRIYKKLIKKENNLFIDSGNVEVNELIEQHNSVKKNKFKNQEQIDYYINHLLKISNGDFETMKEIIKNSIINGYQGIFALKNPVINKSSNAMGLSDEYIREFVKDDDDSIFLNNEETKNDE
jgi:hypothetical protein